MLLSWFHCLIVNCFAKSTNDFLNLQAINHILWLVGEYFYQFLIYRKFNLTFEKLIDKGKLLIRWWEI